MNRNRIEAPVFGGSVQKPPYRIRELDALRGLAAMVVFLHHVFVIFNDEVRTLVTGFGYQLLDLVQAQNKAAVLTFFVLSGYAIGLATRNKQPITRRAIKDYASRRARRILPLYWFSIAWTAILGLVYNSGDQSFSLETLFGNLIFLQTSASAKGNWFEPYGLNGPFWSLSYEAFFYLLLPAALLLVQRWPLKLFRNTSLIGVGLMATMAGFALNSIVPTPFFEFFSVWVVWLVGYVAVDLRQSVRSLAVVATPLMVVTTLTTVLALLGLQSDMMSSVQTGTMIAFLFGFVALYPQWTYWMPIRLVRKAFVKVFGRIGDGSYALYLLHYPLLLALNQFSKRFDAQAWWLVSLVSFGFVVWLCPWLEKMITRLARPQPTDALYT